MSKNVKRLALALLISAGCFLGTVHWFESGKQFAQTGERTPVARLNESSNDVQRKPQKRVIWETVSKNDDLFPGEAIRTSANAEARILLLKSGTVIHLEPDSLVVLEETERGMSLDFLQGNLFVQGSGDDLTLKTGNGEITLNSADMSLSRNQSGEVSLEVHKGAASLQQGGKTVALEKDKSAQLNASGLSLAGERVVITAPRAGETVLLNLPKGEKLDLTYKPLPSGYRVTAEWGKTRASLKALPGDTEGTVGKIALPAKPGKWFVRLVAKSIDTQRPVLASAILPVSIVPKSPPSLLEPSGDGPVVKESPTSPVEFRWVNRHQLESQIIEVSTDPRFKKPVLSQNVEGKATTLESPLPDGTYFWRVTGYLKVGEKIEPLTSPVIKFVAGSNFETKPPVLLAPADQHRISLAHAQNVGVSFKWKPSIAITRHHVLVERETENAWEAVIKKDVDGVGVKTSELKPGRYRWSVHGIDPKGGAPKPSPTWTFAINEMPKIEWADLSPEYEYATPAPRLAARWKPLMGTYRYRVSAKDSVGEWATTTQTSFDIPVATDGAYEVSVEAVDEKGRVMAHSDARTITVKRRPLLPAPQWTQTTPEILKSDYQGNLSFGWEQVEGAKHYLMILEDEDGKVLSKQSVTRTTASVSNLKPGQYKVSVKSVDVLKRPSLESAAKPLVVPAVSDIRAPVIKNMKVK